MSHSRIPIPEITCVMVTRKGRERLIDLSIRSLALQTYRNRRALIVSDDLHDESFRVAVMGSLDAHGVDATLLPCQKADLGTLRNKALESLDLRQYQKVCQWDDDDQYHPERLERQVKSLVGRHRDASFLTSQLYWVAQQRELHVVDWQRMSRLDKRCIPGTILHRVKTRNKYPEVSCGEDSDFRDQYMPNVGTVSNQPWLYLRVFHGANTWTEERFRNNINLWAPRRHVVEAMIPRLARECRSYVLGSGPVRVMHRNDLLLEFKN